jgi:hypothetical protein
VDGRYTHDLLPMPYTFEAAKITAQKVCKVRDFLEVPIAVENVSSYAEFHVSEMTEWEFLNEVVERADCGILLDGNNIYVSYNADPFVFFFVGLLVVIFGPGKFALDTLVDRATRKVVNTGAGSSLA